MDGHIRTALSVEPRDGRLCVFMPPVVSVEDYLDLLQAAEAAAKKLGLPVHIEGYAPPHDPRLNVIRVAPDPGVIEVNIHPAHTWDDCVAITSAVYEEARQTRLGADKFMIDGKHTGTGGGNHVVVGGADAERQPVPAPPRPAAQPDPALEPPPLAVLPVLRPVHRPDLQAPRIDEARHDALYELEIALAQIPAPGQGVPPDALAGGPAAAQPADRCHRQHPPGRDLHRQALFPRRSHRPPGPGGVPRLRDAARPADEPRPATADPRPDRAVLGQPARAAT